MTLYQDLRRAIVILEQFASYEKHEPVNWDAVFALQKNAAEAALLLREQVTAKRPNEVDRWVEQRPARRRPMLFMYRKWAKAEMRKLREKLDRLERTEVQLTYVVGQLRTELRRIKNPKEPFRSKMRRWTGNE